MASECWSVGPTISSTGARGSVEASGRRRRRLTRSQVLGRGAQAANPKRQGQQEHSAQEQPHVGRHEISSMVRCAGIARPSTGGGSVRRYGSGIPGRHSTCGGTPRTEGGRARIPSRAMVSKQDQVVALLEERNEVQAVLEGGRLQAERDVRLACLGEGCGFGMWLHIAAAPPISPARFPGVSALPRATDVCPIRDCD